MTVWKSTSGLSSFRLVPTRGAVASFIPVDSNSLSKAPDPHRPVPNHSLGRRYCYILLIAGWIGGFTFYALIVIPTAERVLDSMRDTGFITQQVTRWLNLIGACVLLILPWLLAGWREQPPRLRFGVAGTWVIMVLAQLGLFATHPLIDRFLEAQGHKLHHYEQFVQMHTLYLTFATVQWSAALIQIWLMLMIWRLQDKQHSASAT